MRGELASPGVRHSRVQQNTSSLPNVSTSMRGDPPFIHFLVVRITAESGCNPVRCNPTVASHQSGLVLILQVMKGRQIQASGLDHLVGWPRSHVAVATKGCVPVVCESEAQRLAAHPKSACMRSRSRAVKKSFKLNALLAKIKNEITNPPTPS